MSGLLLCLKQAHEAGVVNRDVRPENIMQNFADGTVRLIDWAIAFMITSTGIPPFQGTLSAAGPIGRGTW